MAAIGWRPCRREQVGHFGPELRSFILVHYHGLQTSVERLVRLLGDLGASISRRQIMRRYMPGWNVRPGSALMTPVRAGSTLPMKLVGWPHFTGLALQA